ncbi:MAG: hypothetical protein K8U57_40785 [Planctomycetes bacterium]|nr:hypothetical protein [Planctomycetota bacterium]
MAEAQKPHDPRVDEMAKLFVAKVRKLKLDIKWQAIVADLRWTPGTRISKVRAVLKDGSSTPLLDTSLENVPDQMEDIFSELSRLMESGDKPAWYGLKIRVAPKGTYALEFDTNPDCSTDPKFWDD